MSTNILIIEDEQNARNALAKLLSKIGYKVFPAQTAEKGIEIIKKEQVNIVLSDIKLPGIDGLEALSRIKETHPSVPVIMMTAFGSIDKAIKAIKLGALDFIEKPIQLEHIKDLIESALNLPEHLKNRQELLKTLENTTSFAGIIGASKPIKEVFETIIKIAPARTTVLVTGETGTGKELIANAIHQYSNREGNFVPINFSALTDTLFESELFGYVKGAHSTAFHDRKGRLAQANKGTLFMDEVGDIPENIQVKLLRCIETRTFERLGENTSQKVDVRFIAATNVDMEKAVVEGKFREDLYYRLKVLKIEIPPLRDRIDDIPLLVKHFIKKYCKENGRSLCKISKEAMNVLMQYHWPGNVRELENKIEQAVVLAEGDTLEIENFPSEVRQVEAASEGDLIKIPIGTSMKEVEKELIKRTLAKVGGNKTKAAEILGIGTRTLYRKIDEYGL